MKALKFFLITFSILVIFLYFFIISPPGSFLLKQVIQWQLSHQIQSPVEIGHFRTNFFSTIRLSNVVLVEESNKKQPLVTIEKLKIDYDLWGLFNKKIILKNVQIDHPQITIERDKAGHYNFPGKFLSSPKDSLPKTSESTNGYEFKIGSLKIANMNFSYHDQKDSINADLNQMNLVVDRHETEKSYIGKLNIESGCFSWRNLMQRLHQFDLKFSLDQDKFDLTDFLVRSDALRLKSSGSYYFHTQTIQAGKIQSLIDLDFLNHFEPAKSKNLCEGMVSLQCNYEGSINQQEGRINLSLDHGIIYEIPVDNLNANLILKNRDAKLTDFSLDMLTGNVQAAGILSYKNDSLQYQCDLTLRHFQLTQLLRKLYREASNQLEGILEGNFSIEGTGDEWSQLTTNGQIDLTRLSMNSRSYDDIQANFSFAKGKFNFNFAQNESQINLTGIINSDSTIAGKFNGNLSKIESIASLVDLQGLKGKLKFAGDLNGNLESPSVNMNFHFGDGSFQGFPITNIEGGINFKNNQLAFSQLVANGSTSTLQSLAQNISLDSLSGNLSYHIAANGNLDKLNATAEIDWDMATINHFNLDKLILSIKASSKDIFVDKFNIKKQNMQISTSGNVNLHDGLFIDLSSNIFETDSIAKTISNQGLIKIKGKLNNDILAIKIIGEDIIIFPLAKFFSVKEKVDGKLNFVSDIHGQPGRPDFNLTWNLIDPIYKNKSLDTLTGNLNYDNHSLTVSKITTSKNDGTFNLSGEIPIDLYQANLSRAFNPWIQIEAENLDLNLLEPFLPDSILVEGKLSAQLQYQGDLQNPQMAGSLKINNAQLTTPYFSKIDSLYLTCLFKEQQFRLEKLTGAIDGFHYNFEGKGRYENLNSFDASLSGNVAQIGQIQIQGNRRADQTLSGQLRMDDMNLDNLSRIIPIKTQVRGLVAIAMDVTGTLSSPMITMRINSDQIGIEKVQIDSLHLNAFYSQALANIYESGFKIGNGKIALRGNIPVHFFQGDSAAIVANEMEVVSFADDLDIDWLRPFIPGIVNLQGKVDYDLKVAGSLDRPDINGVFNLQNGVIKFKNVNPEINGIHGKINFTRDQIKVDKFSGKIETGSFELQGQTRLNHRKLSDTDLAVTLGKIKLKAPKLFSIGIEKGELALTQSGERFDLGGKIQLKEAKYIQDYRPTITQFLIQIPNRAQTGRTELLNQITLDVIIQGQENLWVENNLAKVQMTSNLNIFGTLAQPNISGRILVNKGYVLYLDREFKITNGLIDFTDPRRINPFIDITAVCAVTDFQNAKEKEYTITLKLSGVLEKPDFMLASEPALDKANIVAILTIGRTRESLFPQAPTSQGQSLQQIMLNRFQEITSQRLAGITEQKLSRTLALENVSIEGNLFQLDKSWGPRLTATKKLSDRINITYSTVVGHANEQQIKLGYQLSKYLSIIGNTGQTGQAGLDLKFHFKFY